MFYTALHGFLNNRSQKVVVEGETSASAPVTSGVPHGSVLGPILFLWYINNLPTQVASRCRLFADDSILYRDIRPLRMQKLSNKILMLWQDGKNGGVCSTIQTSAP